MDALIVILVFVLEAVLLLAGLALFLFRKIKKLHAVVEAQQHALAAVPDEEGGFESIASGFLPYLEKQLIDTREMLTSTAAASHPDEALSHALERRSTFLAAEKKVAELGNDFPKHHWEHVREYYAPAPPAEAAPNATAVAGVAVEQPESVVQLQGTLQQQGVAIESIREVFERVKEDPSAELLEQMEAHLRELEQRYQEANTCIEMMEQENERLQHEVEHADHEKERLEEEKRKTAAELGQQIGKQKQNVAELSELVGGLQLEAEKAAELQKKMAQFELTSRDMNLCIQVLEEENEALHEQVNALQQRGRFDPEQAAELQQKMTALESQLDAALQQKELLQHEIDATRLQLDERTEALGEKEQALAQLQENHAALEKEYLTLYEASQE